MLAQRYSEENPVTNLYLRISWATGRTTCAKASHDRAVCCDILNKVHLLNGKHGRFTWCFAIGLGPVGRKIGRPLPPIENLTLFRGKGKLIRVTND